MGFEKNNPVDVREVQTYLRRIAADYPRIPLLSIDGIYGSKTEEAVRMFQQLFELPITGEVDIATWEALVREFARLRYPESRPQPIRPFLVGEYTLKTEDEGDAVRILQAMLGTLSQYYYNLLPVVCNGRYGDETAAAVKRLQELFGIDPTGTVDRRTWDMLANTYNAYVGR